MICGMKSRALMWLVVILIQGASLAPAAPTTAPVSVQIMPTGNLTQGQKAAMVVTVDIPSRLHAQSHTPSDANYIPFKVTMDANPAVRFGEPNYPAGEDKNYETLGRLNVYTGRVPVEVPFEVLPSAPAGELKLPGTLQYQMCDDQACYPPQRPKLSATATIVGTPTAAPTSAPAIAGVTAPPPTGLMSAWTAFGMALVAGLLFNVMPCVLPVLPLKAVGFYEASQHNRGRSFALGLVFSLGLISVFAVLALVVLVFRFVSWGGLFSQGWFVWSLVALLVVLAFGLLGGWSFSLPIGIYTFEPRHDTFGGNFFWGALTAILATPCTAPLLPPVLLWASAHPAYIGVPAVLMVGVGMALPYLILSATPELARRFPRTGPWAELFKQMMGYLLLAAAAYFAGGRLIHGPGFWWIVVAVVAIACLFLVGRTVQLSKESRPVGIAATIAVILLGGTLWWTAKINGIGAAGGGGVGETFDGYSDQKFQQLRDAGKPVLVKFTANWCGTCQYIEGTVFRDPQVWKALRAHDVTPLKVDFSDDNDAPGKELLLKLNPAGGIPLTAIFSPQAKEPIVLASVYNSQELLRALDRATATSAAAAR
jgi:thiol:disulfide interchange protein DsbD